MNSTDFLLCLINFLFATSEILVPCNMVLVLDYGFLDHTREADYIDLNIISEFVEAGDL